MHKIKMETSFKILKKGTNGYSCLNKESVQGVSIGGFSFDVNGESIPFDWDAESGYEENGIFHFEKGTGFLWNDYEIQVCTEKDSFAANKIQPDDITAAYLASTNNISEFHVEFETNDEEVGMGSADENTPDAEYKLELESISLIDLETNEEFHVDGKVLEKFNAGTR